MSTNIRANGDFIINVDGNVYIRASINTRKIVGGYQVGLLQIRSNYGSIYFASKIDIHPDIFSIRAHKDVHFASKFSLFQFQRGFAAPRVYADNEEITNKRGFQEIIAETGDILLADGAKIDGNDQLLMATPMGSVIGGFNSYFRSQSELTLVAGKDLLLKESRISSVLIKLDAGNLADLTLSQILGTRLQCKIGNGRVPGCQDQTRSMRVSAKKILYSPTVIKLISEENIVLNTK